MRGEVNLEIYYPFTYVFLMERLYSDLIGKGDVTLIVKDGDVIARCTTKLKKRARLVRIKGKLTLESFVPTNTDTYNTPVSEIEEMQIPNGNPFSFFIMFESEDDLQKMYESRIIS